MNKNLIFFNFNEKIHKLCLRKIDLKKTDTCHYKVTNGKFVLFINNKKINFDNYRNNKVQNKNINKFFKLIYNYGEFYRLSNSFHKHTSRKFKLTDNYRDLYNIARNTYLDLVFFFTESHYKNFIFINKIETFFDLAFAQISQLTGSTKFLTRTSVGDKVFFSNDYINKKISFKGNHPKSFQPLSVNNWENKSDEINKKTLKTWESIEINEKNHSKIIKSTKQKELGDLRKFFNNLKPYNGNSYIYYPLHSDPGRTTQPESGIFEDQFISIFVLSKILSDQYTIVLKEHPRQLEVMDYLLHFRGMDFYKNIKKLNNVKIVPITSNTDDLINNSIAIATGTGSSGWVALSRGKPVILFGQPWYSGCYGVIEMNKSIDINKQIKLLNNNKNKILKSYNNLQNFITSKFSSGINQSNISKNKDKDSTNLSKIIIKELKIR